MTQISNVFCLKNTTYKGALFFNYSVFLILQGLFQKLVKMVSLEFVKFLYIVFGFKISIIF